MGSLVVFVQWFFFLICLVTLYCAPSVHCEAFCLFYHSRRTRSFLSTSHILFESPLSNASSSNFHLYILGNNYSQSYQFTQGFMHRMFFKGMLSCSTILSFTSPLLCSVISAAIFFHAAAREFFEVVGQNMGNSLYSSIFVAGLLLPLFSSHLFPGSSPAGVAFRQSYPVLISCPSASDQ